MPTTTRPQAATCRECGTRLEDSDRFWCGRKCHDCHRRSEIRETTQHYLDRIMDSGDEDAMADAIGELEEILSRHGIGVR